MRRLILKASGLMLGAALVFAGVLPAEAQATLQGNWASTKAESDGLAAPQFVGHRMSLSGDNFEITSKDGKALFAGTVRIDPTAKPAAIDFAHTLGTLRGKAWKGIYALNGDTLTICDNADNLAKARPTVFATERASGYVLITFVRAK